MHEGVAGGPDPCSDPLKVQLLDARGSRSLGLVQGV